MPNFDILERAPALFTNLLFALMAPFFVAVEVIYYFFQYRKADMERFNSVAK